MVTIVPAVQIVGSDVEIPTPTPQALTAESITGTPGTGGQKTFGTYGGNPIPEPHRVWKFTVTLPPFSGVGIPIVQSIEPGFDNTSPEAYPIGGRHHFAANFFDATELRILFYGDEMQTPIDYIFAWKRLIRNYNTNTGLDDGTYNYPEGTNGYFRNIVVNLQNVKSQNMYMITYMNCFPTVMAPLRLDYEPSARTVIAQSFVVNRILTQNVSQGGTTANPTIVPAGASFNVTNIQSLQV
jgi:hypothetical protein